MPSTTPSSFTIYNASAGAGKTHTLVRSFLFRLLNSPHPYQIRSLLAITFTNKAAQEMKDRILEKLSLFSKNLDIATEDEMFVELLGQCGTTKEDLHLRAKKAFLYILHHYGYFNVSTIDKLTHQIIRSFARDLGINPRFDVAIDGKAFMSEVVALVLTKAGEDKILTQTLVAYVLQKADELKSWDVSHEVTTIAEMFINENHMQSLAALAKKPTSAFVEFNTKTLEQIQALKQPIEEKAATILSYFQHKGIEPGWFPKQSLPTLLRQLQKGEWSKKPMTETMRGYVASGLFLKVAETKKHQALLDPIVDDIVNVLQTYDRHWQQVTLLQMLRRNIVPLSLMQQIGNQVNTLQQERNTRLLGFFNKQISDTIKDTSAPFIYERMGIRYQHFFVDEFQDTSALQWSNLHPLFSHALEDSERKGSLVLVGDAKQSIYRWRGGYPEQFMKLANKEVPFSVKPNVEPLPTNYRSGAEIVAFNNDFFTKAATFLPRKEQKEWYVNSCNQLSNAKDGGYISLSTIEGKNAEKVVAYQHAVVSRVQDCIRQGFAWEDICILVRKNEQGVQLAKALTNAEIPITSSEALLVGQSPEVQFLMHLVKLRVEPKNKEAKYAVLERFALQQPDPFTWTKDQFARPFGAIVLELTYQKFDFASFQRLTLYAALEYAIWAFSLTHELTAHLQAFLDEVLKLEDKKEATATRLLALWEQQKAHWKISPPEGRNAVRIMTVHKAKGLAFKVVILPFADSKWTDGNKTLTWFPLPKEAYPPFEEMLLPVSTTLTALGEGAQDVYSTHHAQAVLDTLNTLYVGMTRPVEELHIITQLGKHTTSPTGLADVFLHIFPELQEGEVSKGKRKKPLKKAPPKVKTTQTPWQFNLSQAESIVSGVHHNSEERQYGVFFHEIMAKIEVFQDVENALSQSKAKEIMSPEAFSHLGKQVKWVVQHEKLTSFFDPANAVFCERPLLNEAGEILRPDRFVITKDREVMVLDYKTGAFKEEHKSQIYEYANLLNKNMLKVKQIVLVYEEKIIFLEEV